MYSDTLQVFQGCDSIVNTNLTVLEELVLTVEQTQPAIGEDGMDGIAVASAVGGLGDYTFTWCTGETGDDGYGLSCRRAMLRAGN